MSSTFVIPQGSIPRILSRIPQPTTYSEWIRIVGAVRDATESIEEALISIENWCPDYKTKGLRERLNGLECRQTPAPLFALLRMHGSSWKEVCKTEGIAVPAFKNPLRRVPTVAARRIWKKPDDLSIQKFIPASNKVIRLIYKYRFGFELSDYDIEEIRKVMGGQLYAAEPYGIYALSDESGRIFMQRRIDGGMMRMKDGTPVKGKFLFGSDGQWLVGHPKLKANPEKAAWLCEGLPDTLALAFFLRRCHDFTVVVTAPSTSWRPFDEMKEVWGGRRLVICLQMDAASREAGTLWRNKLMPCGARVSLVNPVGLSDGEDVADLLKRKGPNFYFEAKTA